MDWRYWEIEAAVKEALDELAEARNRSDYQPPQSVIDALDDAREKLRALAVEQHGSDEEGPNLEL